MVERLAEEKEPSEVEANQGAVVEASDREVG